MQVEPQSQPPPKPKLNCYSDGESGFMQRSQALRGRWLAPLLALLARLKVRPNHLTLLSLMAGLAFCPVFIAGWEPAALFLLFLHAALDGLDGPLARHTGQASNRGSFTDTAADQVVVAFSTITVIHAGLAGAWPGGLYLFFYSIVVVFAVVRNALAVPYSWLVRPRFFVYCWFAVELYWWPGSLSMVLWVISLLLAAKTLSGFVKIRRQFLF